MTIWPFDREPYAVQQRALDLAYGKEGYAWFLEQGLGKTALALAEFTLLLREDKVDCMVVIVPPGLLGSWPKEAQTLGMNTPIRAWNKKRNKEQERKNRNMLRTTEPFIFLMNYEALSGRGAHYLTEMLGSHRCYLALDESSHIKNPRSQRGVFLRKEKRQASFRRVLSGTPSPQGVHDLWAQMDFVGCMIGMNFYQFRHHFCDMGGYLGKKIVGAKNLDQLARMLEPHSFTAKKKDWWDDCPEKIWMTRDAVMVPRQADLYAEMRDTFIATIDEMGEELVTVDMAISMMMKLQQISSGFIRDEEGNDIELVEPLKNPKAMQALEAISETKGKVITFAHHQYSVRLMRQLFEHYNMPYAYILAKMTGDEIEEQKALFNSVGDPYQILCSLQAGKWGHTLLGGGPDDERCSTTIFFENTYSLETRLQAEDRDHRYGQDRACCYWDVVTSPQDAAVIGALQDKSNLSDRILSALRG